MKNNWGHVEMDQQGGLCDSVVPLPLFVVVHCLNAQGGDEVKSICVVYPKKKKSESDGTERHREKKKRKDHSRDELYRHVFLARTFHSSALCFPLVCPKAEKKRFNEHASNHNGCCG